MGGKLAMVVAFAGLGMLGARALAADQVDNPEYGKWSKFKAGTSVTTRTSEETTMEGVPNAMKSETTVTTTLKEISPTGATVETKMSMVTAGQTRDLPAQTRTVPAKIDKGESARPMEMKDRKEGTEKVTISGKSYETKTVEGTTEMGGNESTIKWWTSEEIPGGVAKMESSVTGSMKMVMKLEVTEIRMP